MRNNKVGEWFYLLHTLPPGGGGWDFYFSSISHSKAIPQEDKNITEKIKYLFWLFISMAEKITLARLKKFGKTFEISVDPDAALAYKKGALNDLREVLKADHIFSDAKKGLLVSERELEQIFKTSDTNKVAHLIIKEGEIQATTEHRAVEREQKRKKLVHLMNTMAVDPKTNLPHPPARIEAALEQGHIILDDHKTAEDQLQIVLAKLRPILALKVEQKKVTVEIPSSYAGKAQGFIRKHQLLKEDWLPSGSWKVVVELPAGLVQEFIDQLNSLTHGEAILDLK